MYLYVFIFLMLSTLGLFTEVYLLQASRLWSEQKAVGELMFVWHSAAYTLAKELSANLGATFPCRVSPTALPATVPICQRYLQDPSGNPVAPYTRHYLPLGYKYSTSQYRFPSLVYKVDNVAYLVTYVPKEANGGTSWLGYTANEILRQLQKTEVPPVSYGRLLSGNCNGVSGQWFATNVYYDSTQVCYPAPQTTTVPPVGYLPAGSVGLVSPL